MSDFTFPTNIKQIGSIGDGFRIYIEDYACSYLQHYAEAGGYEERLAFLVGRYMVIDGQTVLFISGLVRGLHTATEKDVVTFTDRSWQHAVSEVHYYFKGLDIVGWMQSQPGYGIQINSNYEKMHKRMFTRPEQVLFVIDPAEKLNAFYILDEKKDELVESMGYFIYYDKNRGMHEYMLDNKIEKVKIRPLPEIPEAAEPVMDPVIEKIEQGIRKLSAKKKTPTGVKPRKAPPAYNRMLNMLSTVSAALFIVCILTVTGLARNNGRITLLESQLTELNTAYRNLMVEANGKQASTVFAYENGDENTNEALSENESTVNTASLIVENGNQLINENTLAETDTAEGAGIDAQEGVQSEAAAAAEPAAEPPEQTPAATPVPITTPAPVTQNERTIPVSYMVQQGDNLNQISIKFYGTKNMVQDIMTLNGMDDPDKIYFGKVLLLP